MRRRSFSTVMTTWARSRGFFWLLAVSWLVLSLGTAWAEGWPALTGLYYGVIAFTTVGFGDLTPVTTVGQLLAFVFIPIGIVLAFGIGLMIIQEGIRTWKSRREFLMVPSDLKDHFIICGFGNIGQVIARSLQHMGQEVCVVDADAEKIPLMEHEEVFYVIGDAMQKQSLMDARILEARTLITTFEDDSHNVYVVLEAKDLKRDIEILATASNAEAGRKMILAGARRMVSPQTLAGEMLARSALNPGVMEFFREATQDMAGEDLTVSQVIVPEGSWLHEHSLIELGQRLPGVRVLMARSEGETALVPTGSFVVRTSMVLLVVGDPEAVEALAEVEAPAPKEPEEA